MSADKSALSPTPRELAILDLAETHNDPGAADLSERAVVSRWAHDFGGIDIPPPRFTVQTYADGTVTYSVHHGPILSQRELARFAGMAVLGPTSDKRRRAHDRAATVRALALHYLSRRGGGSRTLEAAWVLLYDQVPELYQDEWTREGHYAAIRRLERDYGLVSRKPAA